METQHPDCRIVVRRLSGSTLFKLVLACNALFILPLCLLGSWHAIFGTGVPILVNGHPATGVPALLASLFGGTMMTVGYTLFGWLVLYVGLWLYSRFKPITIRYVPWREGDGGNSKAA